MLIPKTFLNSQIYYNYYIHFLTPTLIEEDYYNKLINKLINKNNNSLELQPELTFYKWQSGGDAFNYLPKQNNDTYLVAIHYLYNDYFYLKYVIIDNKEYYVMMYSHGKPNTFTYFTYNKLFQYK
jgi:hypothetical protein